MRFRYALFGMERCFRSFDHKVTGIVYTADVNYMYLLLFYH